MKPTAVTTVIFILLITTTFTVINSKTLDYKFGPFNGSDYVTLDVISPATISNTALQVTPDSAGNFTLTNTSGRVFFKPKFKLWEDNGNGVIKTASFNTSYLINIYRLNGSTPGEGLAFLISPDLTLPLNSYGQYLGLTNATTDGHSDNHLIAVELDTVKQDFDPDNNHLGLNINGVVSNKTVSLSDLGIQLAPNATVFHMVWIEYDGESNRLDVYMAEQTEKYPVQSQPDKPILTANIDLKSIVNQYSYFGFAAATSNNIELHCVLRWNLTVEVLSETNDDSGLKLKLGLGIGISVLILVVLVIAGLSFHTWKKRRAAMRSESNIMGKLKTLPGMPKEFSFSDLKKATNGFDDKQKLGQGGYGVVYKGLLPKENVLVAVKKFSRDDLQGEDDFLAELMIINRLRHKHLVRLLGWCHQSGSLLLVYDYMPNGSLDNHLFSDGQSQKTSLGWRFRYNIIQGVASALHYLHNEYDQVVVHRDLKASNIMLDDQFNARLGDFGLARALENEKTSYAEVEGVPGTMGYIAPECFHTGKATCESDVFAFGAVLLEVVCGQRPWTKNENFQFLVDWVWWLHREARILEAVDERLGDDYESDEAKRLLLLGMACCHPIGSERPKAMTIIQIVSGNMAVPHVPPFKPPFMWPATQPSSFSNISGMSSLLNSNPNSYNLSGMSSLLNSTADTTPMSVNSSQKVSDFDSFNL
ncbi:hypothetical protein ACFE04_016940 [Oxalis oulophora]